MSAACTPPVSDTDEARCKAVAAESNGEASHNLTNFMYAILRDGTGFKGGGNSSLCMYEI